MTNVAADDLKKTFKPKKNERFSHTNEQNDRQLITVVLYPETFEFELFIVLYFFVSESFEFPKK